MKSYTNLNSLDEFIGKAHQAMKKNNNNKTIIHAEISGAPFGDDQRYILAYTCPITNNNLYKFEHGAMVSFNNRADEINELLRNNTNYIKKGMFPSEIEVKILTNYAELSIKKNQLTNKKVYN